MMEAVLLAGLERCIAGFVYFRSLYQIFSFQSAVHDPWQMEARDELDEQFTAQSLSQCVDIYPSTIRSLNSCLKVAGARMVYPPSKSLTTLGRARRRRFELVRNHFVLRYVVSRQRKRALTLVLQLLSSLIMIYLAYDMGSAMVKLFKHDQLLQDLNQEASRLMDDSGDARLKRFACLNGQNLSKIYLEKLGKLNNLSGKLVSRGIYLRSLFGTYFLLMTMLAPIATMFFTLTCYHLYRKDRIRADTLAMVLSPFEARKFNQAQVDVAIETLQMQLSQRMRQIKMHRRTQWAHFGRIESYKDMNVRTFGTLMFVVEQHKRRKKLLCLLEQLKREKLVRPCTSSLSWLHGLIHMHHFARYGFEAQTMAFVLIHMTYLQLAEASNHLAQHLADLRCKQIGQVSVFHRLVNMPSLSQTDSSKLEQFLQREPTLFESVCLILPIELKYLLPNVRSFIHLAEVLVLCLVASALGIWWVTALIREYSFQVTHLVQVRAQLESINRDLLSDLVPDALELESKLLISYLNFQIFRARYKSFHELKHIVMLLGSCLTVWTFALLYFVASRFETDNRLMILIVAIGIMIYINVILFTASHASRVLRGIMEILVAVLSELEKFYPELNQESLVADLWRRQLLSETEIIHCSATRLLGINVTHTKLIAINVNFVGLCMMMFGFQAHFQRRNEHLQLEAEF